MKYTSTLIAVKDIEKSKRFYYDVLGLDVISDFGANVMLAGGIALQTIDTWKDFIHKRTHLSALIYALENFMLKGSYYSFGLSIYGFLALIALVTVFNIVNSIAMSVAARAKQYGVLRAVGLSGKQLTRMIISEAMTYAVTGSAFGTVLGLAFNYLLFSKLVSFNWGDTWSFPFSELLIILTVIIVSVILAVHKPIKRIRDTSIVESISAW